MDYGIRLFRHVVAQVFGNLGQAAKITAAPFIIFVVVAYLLLGDLVRELFMLPGTQVEIDLTQERWSERFGDPAELTGRFLFALMLIPLGLVLFGWAAVAWHRYVLAEEYVGVVAPFSFGRILGYVGRSILIGLLLGLAMVPILFLLGAILGPAMAAGGGAGLGLLFLMATSFLASWVLVRWSLILPARSMDQDMSIGESWQATKDVSGEILVPILGFAIIFPAIQQALLLFPAGVVVAIAGLFVGWIQMLANLSLLTTLYGNLVQGRELN